ncbi:helix-turn-helix transcriptional regulator [Brevundimonas sp.]|uniref:helix-turn-helix transcriptional regulator n=1 Tax=Brevundimonas sp. TaxID=1871086 RepID=UPI0035AFDAA0
MEPISSFHRLHWPQRAFKGGRNPQVEHASRTDPVDAHPHVAVCSGFQAQGSADGRPAREEAPAEYGLGWWFLLDPAPRYLVGSEGALLLANPAGQSAIEAGQFALTHEGSLKFGCADSDRRYKAALLRVARGDAYAFAILRKPYGGWLAADIHGVPGHPRAMLAFREAMASTQESMNAISEVFQLTRSEGGVLHRLLDGACPKSAANDLNISEHTVRAHLRSIYAKMGVNGLVEMVRLSCAFM